MRIISGKYRGRILKGPAGLELRPTGDRLKESLFDILGSAIAGCIVLDAFGGSGSIGIEAISRGASEVAFIEGNTAAYRLIKKNLEICGIKTGYRIVQQDIFAALRSLAREGFKANIVFFDPPYDFQPYQDLLELVFKKELLLDSSRVIIEHHRKADLPESGEGYCRVRVVRQGDHCLSFYERSEEVRSQKSE